MTLPDMNTPNHFRQRLAACGLSLAAGVCWAADPKPPVMDAGALHRQTDQSVRAYVPQQDLSGDTLTLQILETLTQSLPK